MRTLLKYANAALANYSVIAYSHTKLTCLTDLGLYQQSVFKRYHSDKHFSESFYLQDGSKIIWHRHGTKLRMVTIGLCIVSVGLFCAPRLLGSCCLGVRFTK